MKEKTVKDMLGLRQVIYTQAGTLQTLGLKEDPECPLPNRLVGIEFEIERVKEINQRGLINSKEINTLYTTERDGSLRNEGLEFITTPLLGGYVKDFLKYFFECGKFNENNYSDRTSVHVHLNMLDATRKEVFNLMLLYQVFEDALYGFAGGGRHENIFCVPWSESGMSANKGKAVIRELQGLTRAWYKYTGLNVAPLRTRGTVEFRHLPGTCNRDTILSWVYMILELAKAAGQIKTDDLVSKLMELNTSSDYEKFATTIFPTTWRTIIGQANFRDVIQRGVVEAKLMLGEDKNYWNASEIKYPTWCNDYERQQISQEAATFSREGYIPFNGREIDDHALIELIHFSGLSVSSGYPEWEANGLLNFFSLYKAANKVIEQAIKEGDLPYGSLGLLSFRSANLSMLIRDFKDFDPKNPKQQVKKKATFDDLLAAQVEMAAQAMEPGQIMAQAADRPNLARNAAVRPAPRRAAR